MKKSNVFKNGIIILGTIIFVLVSIILFNIIKKSTILNNLSNLAKEKFGISNYFYSVENYNGQYQYLGVTDNYIKDNQYMLKGSEYTKDGVISYIGYSNGEDIISIKEDKDSLMATINGKNTGDTTLSFGGLTFKDIMQIVYYEEWTKFDFIMNSKIELEQCNNKDCYFIQYKDLKIWIEKETGLIVRMMQGKFLYNYTFKFNCVKDEDIAKPDISKFQL